MGRKIPGKKHRGVKDPYVQQFTRNESIKNKINAPPVEIDEQPLPESLQKIILWQHLESKGGNRRKKRKNRNALIDSRNLEMPEMRERGMDRPDKPTPAFIQRVGETDKRFLNRVDEICEEMIKESKINQEFNSETTEPDPPSRKRKGDVETIMSAGGKQQKNIKNNEAHVPKKEKIKLLLAAKKQAKLEKRQEQLDDKMRFRDHVEFGEIVHAPPVLNLPSRNKLAISDAKPGQRELILKQLLPLSGQVASTRPASQKGKGGKTKMRDLPIAERDRLERNRLQAVQDYRRLKSSKMSRAT